MTRATREAIGPHTPDEQDRYYADGDWQDAVLYDIVADAARRFPDRTYVTDGDHTVSYGQLRDRALRLAQGLADLGVSRGDRIAAQLPNWAEFALITVAASRLGAVLVPIMAIYRKDEVGYILEHSGAEVVIGPDVFNKFDYRGMYLELQAELPSLETVVTVRPEDGADLGSATNLRALFSEQEPDAIDAALPQPAGPDDVALIVYTSGTTNRPKGCVHTFNTLHASATGMIRKLGVTETDVMFNPSPVCHSTGLVTGLLMPILVGGSTHFMPVWNPVEGHERIARYRTTITVTATPFLVMAMGAFDPAVHDISSMRYWVCAGSPIPGSVIEHARELFPTMAPLSLYGRTENMITTMCGPDDAPERSATTDGRAMPGAVVKVVGDDGYEVPRGESGDLAYRGPSHILGYYNDPVNTAELYTPEGFSRSGDLGHMDADGFVRVSGRLKDIIIRGGVNISSREVEDLLLTHPAVKDVAVVAMPDELLGEKCCAYVVVAEGAEAPTLAEATDFLRAKEIAAQKLPERIEIIDALPLTATGKVRKNVLRDLIAEKLRTETPLRVE